MSERREMFRGGFRDEEADGPDVIEDPLSRTGMERSSLVESVGRRWPRLSLVRGLRRGGVIVLLAAFAVFLLGVAAAPARAGSYPSLLDNNIVGSHSPLEIVNLYWDTNWDADNPGLPTRETLDNFTSTMYSSQYLSALSQYGVSFGGGFLGSYQADPGCGTAPASIGYFDINGFVNCERHTFGIGGYTWWNPGTYGAEIIYMVYTPAATTWGGSCPSFDGFHALTLGSLAPPDLPQYFGFVLSACAGGGSLNGITSAASHEAVEAATDPWPTLGWIDNDTFTSISVDGLTNLLTAGEAADLCDPGTTTPVPGLGLDAPGQGPMYGGAQPYQVAYYWSNSAGQCVLPAESDLSIDSEPNITTTATSAAGAAVTFTVPPASDEGAENPSVTCADSSGNAKQPGNVFPVGSTTLTCTATDLDDSPSSVNTEFVITVTDNDLALAGIPADISTNATSPSGAVVSFPPPTASDEGGQTPPVTCNHNPGDTFPIGVTTVTCTANAADHDDGNSPVSASFSVTVRDTDLALTSVPAPITANATSPSGAVVTYTPPTAVDEDTPLPTVTCDHPSGSVFAIATTTVTCTVTDADDLNGPISVTFTVTVKGAMAQLQDLLAYVQSLPPGTSLSDKVQTAIGYLQTGDTADACSTLESIVHEATAQSGKHLTTAQATEITTTANRIRAVLAC